MRKVLPYLGASLSLLAAAWATSAKAQNATTFMDVPTDHWAYQAVTDLQQKGVIVGYPDGYFRGKRTLTRYEFAVALERALTKLPPGPAGPQGPQGEPGPAGPQGPPGMTPEEVTELRNLTQEFRTDLANLGADVKAIQNRLDQLANELNALRDLINRMPKWSGDLFFGFRADKSRYPFFDYSGAARGANQGSLVDAVDSPHDLHLGVRANLPGDVKLVADTVFSNYLSYRNSFPATAGVPNNTFVSLGGPSAANPNGGPEAVTIYQANLQIPIGSFGKGTQLVVGRFKNQVTPLTYYRPDTDAYFDIPWYDDGNFVEDGLMLKSQFGSATTSLWAGSYSGLTDTTGLALINAPVIGANFGLRALSSQKPTGLVFPMPGIYPDGRGQSFAKQSLGLHVGIPLFKFGELGLTAIDFSTGGAISTEPVGMPPFSTNWNNVVVYGANLKLKQIGRFQVSAEGAKSVTQVGLSGAGDSANSNDDNNAGTINVGWESRGVGVQLGYQYIDPRFAAPGYWNKIGNWYDPANVRGPFGRVNYKVSNTLLAYLGGDYYEGARNRVGLPGSGLGWSIGSNLVRGTAGVKYTLHKVVLSADYEGVFYSLSGSVSASGGRAKPVEQYITLGAGLNLASNTVLKLAYQIINQQDIGGGFGSVVPGLPDAFGGNTSNANVFTTQLAVHF